MHRNRLMIEEKSKIVSAGSLRSPDPSASRAPAYSCIAPWNCCLTIGETGIVLKKAD